MYLFFSSRRRHTTWPRDWSSDVCSSDLGFIGRADGVVQDDRLVKILIKGRQVVVDDQDRGSRGSQPMKDGDNHLFGGHVHSRKWLVEQDEARLLRDRPRQEHALLLAAR